MSGQQDESGGEGSEVLDVLDEDDASEYLEEGEEASDADSDYRELQTSIAKLEESVRKFRHEQRGVDSEEEDDGNHQLGRGGRGRGRNKKGRTTFRGPRKAAEPTGDIRARLGRASQAFILENYEEATSLVEEVIRINAETHEAWTLLAAILREQGDVEKTVHTLVYAAHLRPKDAAQWLEVARFALEETGELRTKFLPTAKFCYSSAIRASTKGDFEARIGKAAVLWEMGNASGAAAEYKHVLRQRPHDLSIIRSIAHAYIDIDKVEMAQDLYKDAIVFYKAKKAATAQFTWDDANVYVELYPHAGQYAQAIRELKSVARWLLGRESESYWEDVTEDDREWDDADERRRLSPNFVEGQFSSAQYGLGLPLEFHVNLGLFRLKLGHVTEALKHLNRLDPDNESLEDRVNDYYDLYRYTGDNLLDAGLPEEALKYYHVLKEVPNQPAEASLHLQMGKCFLRLDRGREAEESFQTTISVDPENIDARRFLAKMYEDLDEPEQAFIYVNELIRLRRLQNSKKKKQTEDNAHTGENDTLMPAAARRRSYYKSKRLLNKEERLRQEAATVDRLLGQYSLMRLKKDGMRAGHPQATEAWMEAAADMIEDFRGFKQFYSWDKYIRFLGYRDQPLTGATPLDAEMAEMASRISTRLGAEGENKNTSKPEVPENYRGIAFSTWLDIFLEYALCLARTERAQEAYEICEAAKDAIVFYHSREDMFLIHLCWCTCAVLVSDEETCVETCRYFMKDYQFTTDTYRMFGALTRLCQSPLSWYSAGPTQKYILRQIKAMDYVLVSPEARKKYFAEKGSYSARDANGNLIINTDMDVALLMTYGHILYTGTSYTYALNYFFRAHALDPENPMIKLSIGLGYVHYGMKRQAENRQFHIMQGLTFLLDYYERRKRSIHVQERQEASYNIARTYHMLGLTHLAIPFYQEVLDEAGKLHIEGEEEDMTLDAAYNLQTIFAMAGNLELARRITCQWLTV